MLFVPNSLQTFFSLSGGWSPAGSSWPGGHWLANCTCPGWLWWWRILWNEDWQGKQKYSEKTLPSATLSTTYPTWPDPGSNPGTRGEKSNRHTEFLVFRGLCLWRLFSVWTFFPVAGFSRWLLSNCSCCTHFKAARLERFPPKLWFSPGVPPSSSSSDRWSMPLQTCVLSYFFSGISFRSGWPDPSTIAWPLHNLLTLTSRRPMKVRTICFTTYGFMGFLKILPDVPSYLRCSCILSLGPLFLCCIPSVSIVSLRASVL
jgi:hypothetical protein